MLLPMLLPKGHPMLLPMLLPIILRETLQNVAESATGGAMFRAAVVLVAAIQAAPPAPVTLPVQPLVFGAFTARFDPSGTFRIEGGGWPTLEGTWTIAGSEIELRTPAAPKECAQPARYRVDPAGGRPTFALIADPCISRRMILDRSSWRPASEAVPRAQRRIVVTPLARPPAMPFAPVKGSWPSFRGAQASGVADGQQLPDTWSPKAGEHVRWRTPIPGLAHSSPIVWGDRVFVTSAVSSDAKATFRPGLYGDGDASADRSTQRWMLYALDAASGKILWERVAFEGPPRELRHVKSTYASATPATDGRLVVASFGSQGVYAYDVTGTLLWKADLGRLDVGAYDIPTFEWGTASSPIIWNGLVILQCDTQADSFIVALDAATGKVAWKTERDELPSWGTPTVATTSKGAELVTNASKFVRGYDPRTGTELWRLGRSSKITAPTPIASGDLLVVASGRAPERPIFVVKAGSRGDLTLNEGQTSSAAIAWTRTGRGSYMPTPLAYQGILYVLANNGVLDAYDMQTGEEIYRQRLPVVGSGFSASPVAADGKIYLSNEDGEILVVQAGRTFKHLATNSMGELLMATPALSNGTMFVRSSTSVSAISAKE
jgi:outer membrane protein assembly factor BamB